MHLELGWVRDKVKNLDLGIKTITVFCVNIYLWNLPDTFTCVCQRHENGSTLSERRIETPANYWVLSSSKAKSLQSCPTVWPHRRQPTRLCHPWDSPGKNTGVGCHFLLQCMKVKSESEVAQSCPTLSDPMDCSLPGSSLCGIFQARVLERGAIAFSEVVLSPPKLFLFLYLFFSSLKFSHSFGTHITAISLLLPNETCLLLTH